MPLTSRAAMARAAWLYLGIGSCMAIAYFFQRGPVGHHAFYDGVGLSAVAVAVYGIHRNRPPASRAWYLLALGQFALVCGDLTRAHYEVAVGGAAPFPGFSDIAHVAAYPILIVAVVLLVRGRERTADRANVLDGLIVVTVAGLLSWVFLIEPQIHNPGHLSLLGLTLSIAYPLFDLLLVAVAARLMFSAGARHTSYYLLCASLLALLTADSIHTYMLINGTYHTGTAADAGYLASYLLWGAAALHPSSRDVAQPDATLPIGITRQRLLVLTIVIALAPAVRIIESLRNEHVTVYSTAVPTIIVVLLVMVRLSGVVDKLGGALSKHEEAERRRRQSEARFGSLVEHASDIVLLLNRGGEVLYQSPSVTRVLGYETGGLLMQSFVGLIHERDRSATVAVIGEAMGRAASEPASLRFRCQHHDGSWLHLDATLTNLLKDPTVGGLVLNARDVTEQVELQSRLAHQAFHDPLTDLANRALFRDRVEHALRRRSTLDRPLGVMLLDIDDFKRVNDSLGHAAGDQLLVDLAERIRGCIRAEDTAARLGGDEFAVLVEESRDPEKVAKRLTEGLRPSFLIGSSEVFITASIGISTGDVSQGDADDLLRNADAAMYAAKSRGKGEAVAFRPEMHRLAFRRMELDAQLRRAIDEDEFRIHYQPIVDMKTRRLGGFEALVRWDHPIRGLLAPGEFIGVAEESGLIRSIGRVVLEGAARQAQAWADRYPGQQLTISVNLSAGQFADEELVDDVARALEDSGLDPSRLVLEMTESVLMADTEATTARLAELRGLGVRLCLDDFGTGFSSLNHLRGFPIDVLKIAKQFLDRVPEGEQEAALVRGIIELGHSLDLLVIGEGIERQTQWDALLEMGCDLAQGYLVARAQPPERIDEILSGLGRSRMLVVG